jgi:hypothetical protein
VKTRVRRGHFIKRHFPVATARCQAVALPKAVFAPQAIFFALPRDHDINLMRCRLQKSLGAQA